MAEKAVKSQSQKQTKKFDIKEIYTPLSVAKKEIWRRWNDKELRKKVEDFLGGDVPKVFRKEPKAALARHVITPNLELSHFLELSNLINLKPIGLEYLKDTYLSCNPAKLFLGKICFFKKTQKNGEGKINHVHIIDFLNSEKKSLDEIKTVWGENLVDFHHKMLKASKADIEKFDISGWYSKNGGRARSYMKYYLALFICNGILFENYLTQKNEKKFTYDVVFPAFKEIEKVFGLKPLIIPIMPSSEKDEAYWWSYSDQFKKYINFKK